MMHVVCGSDLI